MPSEFFITYDQNTSAVDGGDPIWEPQEATFGDEDRATKIAQELFFQSSFGGPIRNVTLQSREVGDWLSIPLTLPPDMPVP